MVIAYITGYTTSTDFPTTPGAWDTNLSGDLNAFMTKLNTTGSGLAYSTYFTAVGFGIALDGAGNPYITGQAGQGLPITPSAYDISPNGDVDAFVAKFFLSPIEVCDNGIDDDGDNLIDCDDPDCTKYPACRPDLVSEPEGVFIDGPTREGKRVLATLRIKNQGEKIAKRFTVNIFLSQDDKLDVPGDKLIKRRSLSGLGIGDTQDVIIDKEFL